MKNIYKILTAFIFSLHIGYAQWNFHSAFPKTVSIMDISTGQSGTVYVLTTDRRIYFSSDNGNTWSSFVQTHGFFNALDIEASQVSPRVFIKTTCCGVAYTDNLGANWFWDNLHTNQTSGLGLAPNDIDVLNNRVAAVTQRFDNNFQPINELYMSAGNGTSGTWTLKHTFAADFTPEKVFLVNNNLLFVSATLPAASPSNTVTLQKSVDGGNTFSNVSYFNDKQITDMLPVSSQTIYCAAHTLTASELHVSHDAGNSWSAVTPPDNQSKIIKLAFDNNNNYLYALTENGIYRKTTNGNWNQILSEQNLQTVLINNLSEILTGGIQVVGIKKSPHNPIHFQTSEIGGEFSPQWMKISNNNIFIGNKANPVISKSAINLPGQWQHTAILNISLTQEQVSEGQTAGSFIAHKKSNDNLLISGNNYIAEMQPNMNFTILSDINSGAPAAPLSNNAFIPRNFKLGNNDDLLVKQPGANYIDYSPDGTGWFVLNPVQTEPTKIIIDFCAGTNHFYVLINDFAQVSGYELYYSPDGLTWNTLPLPPNTDGKKIFVDNTDNLYLLATNPVTLYQLDLNNQQWTSLNLNLHNDPNIYFELVFDQNNNMYALNFSPTTTNSPSQGIAYSNDQGATWTYVDFPTIGTGTVFLDNLNVDSSGMIYAKSSYFHNNSSVTPGIYKHQTVFNISEIDKNAFRIYPNPFSDRLFIESKHSARFNITDLSGKIIKSGFISEGNNIIELPENRATGIYLIRFQTNRFIYTKKIIKNR